MTELLSNASFDWKKLKEFLFSQEGIDFQVQLSKELRRHTHHQIKNNRGLCMDEERRISARTVFVLLQLKQKFLKQINESKQASKLWVYAIYSVAPSAALLYGVASDVFPNTIRRFGTASHMNIWQMAVEGKIIGAFCLTEFGHGSNTKSIQTTATYNKKNKEFILNTPSFEAAKCWSGALGMLATYAVVYAQLIMSDGVNQGINMFLLPLRNPETYLAYPGVIIGDMGEKIGLNGTDNGFVLFNHYRVPKSCLLNKLADINYEGKYIRHAPSKKKQFGASLGILSRGRITIIAISNNYLCRALSTAFKYAAIKKIKLDDKYIQRSLLPYLSVAYVTDIIITYIYTVQDKFLKNTADPKAGIELHAVSSAGKALTSWTVRNGIQECLDICVDFDFIKTAGLIDLIANHDANSTYEGECHVIIQQTANWLLKLWPSVLNHQKIDFPLGTVNFLNNALTILVTIEFKMQSPEEFMAPTNLLVHFQWLICYLIKESYNKTQHLTSKHQSAFWAKQESQVYFCKTLAVAYFQAFIIQHLNSKIETSSDDVKTILSKLLSLYGVWSLEMHLGHFYKSGYARTGDFAKLIRKSITFLNNELKNDAVTLVNVITPPEAFISSVFDCSRYEERPRMDNLFSSHKSKL